MRRLYLAYVAFFRVLFGKPLPAELLPKPEQAALPEPTTPAPAPAAPAPKPEPPKVDLTVGALQLLQLFQREGRLVDFLNEGIDSYDDASIGAAVRDIHKGCKKVLADHFGVEPVLAQAENDPVTVDKGFDPVGIRLLGNVVGEPPFKGVLRHHGWRAAKVALPTVADDLDQTVVAPAEVELS